MVVKKTTDNSKTKKNITPSFMIFIIILTVYAITLYISLYYSDIL